MMRKHLTNYSKSIRLFIQCGILHLYFALAKFVGVRLQVTHVRIVDPIVTSDITTIVWEGDGCYKIELSTGEVYMGAIRKIPLCLNVNSKSVSIKFRGVGSIIERSLGVNKHSISPSIPKTYLNGFPKLVALNKNCTGITDIKPRILTSKLPSIRFSLPEFPNQ